MDLETALMQALREHPSDETSWLVLADWLEDHGQYARAELLRLHRSLRGPVDEEERGQRESRIRELIAHGVKPCVPEAINSIGMRLALIPAGTFWMGSPSDEPERYADESPVHEVELTRPFYLGVFPVTQAEYEQVMDANPSWFSPNGEGGHKVEGIDRGQLPVDSATWEDAFAFCENLSNLPAERAAGRRYRLPTEAEWEYACRAGPSRAAYHFGPYLMYEDANFDDVHCPRRPTPVGSYKPNAFGLYDMHGNVWEWCNDWWGEDYYDESPRLDPPGPASGIGHVIRGGSWANSRRFCRSACRYRVPPCEHGVGFRVALTIG